jgi:hypothetical protein
MIRLPFLLRKPAHQEPIMVSMTGTRLGEKVIFAGDTASLLLPLAARVGLSGQLTVVAAGSAALKAVAENEGILVDTEPPHDGSYDLAVVEIRSGWDNELIRLRSAVRSGGRIIIVGGDSRKGFLARLRASRDSGPDVPSIVTALSAAGWRRAREIGEHEGLRFVEAFNP